MYVILHILYSIFNFNHYLLFDKTFLYDLRDCSVLCVFVIRDCSSVSFLFISNARFFSFIYDFLH